MLKIKNFIKKQIKKGGTRYLKGRFLKHYPEEYKKIIKLSNFLDANRDITFSERLYCILNDINKKVLCQECKMGYVKFSNFNMGYHKYCSKRCKALSKDVQDMIQKTMLNKYGYRYSFCSNSHRERATIALQNKCKEDKGFTEKITKKRKETNLKMYGDEVPMNCDFIKEKKKKTMVKKYGVEHSSQSKKCMEKMKQTNLDRYGYESAMQNEKVIEKSRQTKIKNGTKPFIFPSTGINEKMLLDIQERKDNCKIDRKFTVLNYHPDGYCHKTNTIYEVYEKKHAYPQSKKHDMKRQSKIQKKLGCNFIILWDLTH